MNRRLHAERLHPGTHRRHFHEVAWSELPDGAFVIDDDGTPSRVRGTDLIPWTPAGYGEPRRRPRRGTATAITPPATLAVLRAGYPVQVAAG
jgi:hypothetical protein